MRIGLSTLETSQGGPRVRNYAEALIRALLAREESPDLVLFVLEEDMPRFAAELPRAELVPVLEQFRDPQQQQKWREEQLPGLVREHDLDVLHLTGYGRLQWRGPCPLLITIHDLTHLKDVRKKKDWETGFFERVVARKPQPQVPSFVATSEYFARRVEEHMELPHGSVASIPVGVDRAQFQPGSAVDAKTAVGALFDLKEPFFLYVARLDHPDANHVGLLAAFNRFKRRTRSPWQLMIVGEEGVDAAAISKAIQQSPYVTDIRTSPPLEPVVMPLLYRAADAFVFPSLEDLPDIDVIEAMACGCPVISSKRGVLQEWLGDATSLIDPNDMDDFASKLAAMAGSVELRQRWRQASLAQARRFDWQLAAAATLALYERLFAQHFPGQ